MVIMVKSELDFGRLILLGRAGIGLVMKKNIEVEVYSKYPIVRLYLDDKLVGEKGIGRETEMKAVFSLPFKPGTLKVEGVENGVVKDTKMLSSASEPVAIRTKVENREMKADGKRRWIRV